MKATNPPRLLRARLKPLAVAAATLFAGSAWAQAPEAGAAPPAAGPGADVATADTSSGEGGDVMEIVVTATRRKTTILDIPINVSAVTADDIAKQGLTDMADLTRVTPGLFLSDQGGRDTNLLTVRGLNANSLNASEFTGVDGGGVVAQYLGDIPLFIDLHLLDLERVEVLLGPQGTLYGAGTLGGAIRYLPNRPKFGETTLTVDAGTYLMGHSDNLGAESSVTGNWPIGDDTAIRATVGYSRDPGFIDSPYLVRVPGGSNPDPDFSNPADVEANLRNEDDVNRGDEVSGRFGIRHNFADKLDANLTYYYQKQHSGGRTINDTDSFGTDKYENAERYKEPNTRRDQLGSLELKADLGFAELTSATGYSQHDEHGSRDQTDLLLDFEYGYEDFPTFSAFTFEGVNERRLNQEIRLVSPGDEAFKWIAGVFYNRLHHNDTTYEFVPGIPEFFGVDRPDNLEFYQVTKEHLTEKAVFGEIGYDIVPEWNVTVGARYFKFKDRQTVGVALPLIDGSAPDELAVGFDEASNSDDKVIFKANTSYKVTPDVLGYFTVSQGYRTGGGNAVPLCDAEDPDGQNVCALPSERKFKPDTTLNYEVGAHTKLLGGKLVLNADVYYIDWKDAQVGSVTVNGALPIIINADKARSRGVELATNMLFDEHWSGQLSYTYTDAELRSDAPGILRSSVPGTPDVVFGDAKKGDRLPGSPKHQGNAQITWTNPLPEDLTFEASYGIAAQSDVISKPGKRLDGESMGGYAIHFASASVSSDDWTLRLWAKNLFDRYAETGVRQDRNSIGVIGGDADGDGVDDHSFRLRRYYHSVLTPMQIGLTYTYRFKF